MSVKRWMDQGEKSHFPPWKSEEKCLCKLISKGGREFDFSHPGQKYRPGWVHFSRRSQLICPCALYSRQLFELQCRMLDTSLLRSWPRHTVRLHSYQPFERRFGAVGSSSSGRLIVGISNVFEASNTMLIIVGFMTKTAKLLIWHGY